MVAALTLVAVPVFVLEDQIAWGPAGALAVGCNIVTPIVYAVSPPPKQPALYPLEDRPTVVYVDDRRNLLSYRSLRRRIGDVRRCLPFW